MPLKPRSSLVAAWDESLHPRDAGKFATSQGGQGKKQAQQRAAENAAAKEKLHPGHPLKPKVPKPKMSKSQREKALVKAILDGLRDVIPHLSNAQAKALVENIQKMAEAFITGQANAPHHGGAKKGGHRKSASLKPKGKTNATTANPKGGNSGGSSSATKKKGGSNSALPQGAAGIIAGLTRLLTITKDSGKIPQPVRNKLRKAVNELSRQQAMTAALVASEFSEELHPRGLDGRFISVTLDFEPNWLRVHDNFTGDATYIPKGQQPRLKAYLDGSLPADRVKTHEQGNNEFAVQILNDDGTTALWVPGSQIQNLKALNRDGHFDGDPASTDSGGTGTPAPATPAAPVNVTKLSVDNPDDVATITALTGQERIDFLTAFVEDKKNGDRFDTEKANSTQIAGMTYYTAARRKQHEAIIDEILNAADANGVKRERKALMSGGLGGSGKGTILGGNEKAGIPALINEHEWLTIDPDVVKQKLLERGMGPDIPGLQPFESASFIHEESSHIAKQLTEAAAARGLNTVLDTTMATEDSTRKRAKTMQDAGYSLEAVFADVPISVSKASALGRYERAAQDFRDDGGTSLGGRFVPFGYIDKSAPDPGSPYQSKNRQTLENLRNEGFFERVRVIDNSGSLVKRLPEPVYDWNKVDGFTSGSDTTGEASLPKAQKDALLLAARDKVRSARADHGADSPQSQMAKTEYEALVKALFPTQR